MHAFDTAAGVPYNVSVIPVNLAGEGEFETVTLFTEELSKFSHGFECYMIMWLLACSSR